MVDWICPHCGKGYLKGCKRCHRLKEASEFDVQSFNSDGLSAYCKSCETEMNSELKRKASGKSGSEGRI
jgi:hypothetical protein